VLTGGASVMPGMIELGEEIFHMPVRLGVPSIRGPSPTWCRARALRPLAVLLLEAQTQRKRGLKVRETRDVKQVFGRMKSWFEKNF
jgi:cell division protein FtsA